LQDVDRDALAEFDQAEQQMLGADEIVVESVGFLPRQREDLLRSGRKIVHRFIAHTTKMLLSVRFVQLWRRSFCGDWMRPIQVQQAFAQHVGPQEVSFVRGQFFRE